MSTTDGRTTLSDDVLVNAREVLTSYIVGEVRMLSDEDGLDCLVKLRDLGRIQTSIGRVGDPIAPSFGSRALEPDQIAVLIEAARWEDWEGIQIAEKNWSEDVVGVDEARRVACERAWSAQRLLEALGADRDERALRDAT